MPRTMTKSGLVTIRLPEALVARIWCHAGRRHIHRSPSEFANAACLRYLEELEA